MKNRSMHTEFKPLFFYTIVLAKIILVHPKCQIILVHHKIINDSNIAIAILNFFLLLPVKLLLLILITYFVW